MNKDQRVIQRKLRKQRYTEEIDHVAKTCRYFVIGHANFHRWGKAYSNRGEAGLINSQPIPKWLANRTPPEARKRCFTFVVNSISDQCGSLGIWSAITASNCLTQPFRAFGIGWAASNIPTPWKSRGLGLIATLCLASGFGAVGY
ncbi:hypothetical protein LX82_02539 [Celeribacter halophilus]|uniref:Uncharacterized protein n=1 Tax=Celeribacter halophilus TaxID=576117 RepID=A0A1I3UC54_9RHOB|nr:hypothetical protein LX82_02539 [Celeribacter halophilus]SFJ79367.1 hypothetical protein SAMN04488138_110123 [Celeribacter halophilus]